MTRLSKLVLLSMAVAIIIGVNAVPLIVEQRLPDFSVPLLVLILVLAFTTFEWVRYLRGRKLALGG